MMMTTRDCQRTTRSAAWLLTAFAAALMLGEPRTMLSAEAWSSQHHHRPRHAPARQQQRQQRTATTRLNLIGGLRREAEAAPANPTAAQAVALSDADSVWNDLPSKPTAAASLQEFWLPVLSSAALITGNTFGAGSLVVPELAANPGLAATSGVFLAAYTVNLISGLLLANISITQYETNQKRNSKNAANVAEVPTSFQELALSNLKSQELATVMSLVAFSVNALVLAFDISRVGVLFQGAVDPQLADTLWAGLLVTLAATQSSQTLSQAASVCVALLFASFGSLLLPGLASLTNPLGDWFMPGAAAFDSPVFWSSVSDMAPVILISMIFQNVVPTVARLQDYDRARTFSAIGLGSFMPLAMYLGWTWACLGQGGIDLAAIVTQGLGQNPLLALFSLATLAGSSIGCTLSCASELDIFVKKFQGQDEDLAASAKKATSDNKKKEEENGDDPLRFQLVSVLATVGLPLGLNFAFTNGGDLTGALHVAGGLGSPLLYGIIPAMMAYQQMQTQQPQDKQEASPSSNNNVVGKVGLGALGLASTTLFCENLLDCVSAALPTVLPTAMAATEAVAVVV